MKSLKFKTNINCNNCLRSVTPALNAVDSIEEWKVDLASTEKVLEVETEDGNEGEVISAVQSAGFNIEILK